MIRYSTYLLLIFSFFLISCGKLGLYSASKGEKVATVASFTLYEHDISDYFSAKPYISDSDSMALRKLFIDKWIRDHVIQDAANEEITKSSSIAKAEIESRVNHFKNQLIINEFENSFVENNIDTMISKQSILDYYSNHMSSFKLSSPLIKCLVARIPSGVRQSQKLQNLFKSKREDDFFEFSEICSKNDYLLLDLSDNWIEVSDIVKYVPLSSSKADDYFSKKNFYSIEDENWIYMIKINSYLPSGSFIPVERETANIKKILLHERRLILRNFLEDSIIKSAFSKGIVNIL